MAQQLLHNTHDRDFTEKASVQSLDRGLIILEAVAKSPNPVKLTEMAVILGVDRSSAFRLASTLKRRGFLSCPSGRKDYILGSALWRLSRYYHWSRRNLVEVCHEQLRLLADDTGETAHVAVQEGRHALFIDHVASHHVLAISGQTGERVPLHCTAHGKALLTDFDQSALQVLFGMEPLKAYTSETIVLIDQLAGICGQVQSLGFATDDGEFGAGIRCVAAPIRDQDGGIIASIGISAPLTRFPDQRYSSCAARVMEAAEKINQILAGQSEPASNITAAAGSDEVTRP